MLLRLPRLLAITLMFLPVQADDWPRFRGPNGSGISRLTGIPTQWDTSRITWKTKLPGPGHSSPCITGKHLFVTAATDDGKQRLLISLNADTGTTNWTRSLALNSSHHHQKNSWASSTPATDGNRVCTCFADDTEYVAAAWDLEGKELWRTSLGQFDSQHGSGASPVIEGGLLIIPNDQLGPSSLVAIDVQSGEIRWTQTRPAGRTAYTTPLVTRLHNVPVLICVSQSSGISCLNLSTGEQLWQTEEFPLRTIASPVLSHGLVLATCGSRGGGKELRAVRLDSHEEESRIAFRKTRRLPYVPTPVIWEDHAILWGDGGVVSCLKLPAGRVLWTKRIAGDFTSSPICIDGHVYCVSEAGVVTVVAASPEFEGAQHSPLGDSCHASPAVANGHLYFRTFHHLIAIKAN